MASANFKPSLDFVWQPGFDSPRDGYHVTPGDSGGGTKGGVIQVSWANAVRQGIVSGALVNASDDQLSLVLRHNFWGSVCDNLPDGIDFLLFNGRMMSGRYPVLFQESLGFIGDDLDGYIGPETIKATNSMDAATLINALHGIHYAYCATLPSWSRFAGGWTKRLIAAKTLALSLISKE